jgi:RNA polymerase sigma factor (TIGR02999 family)
LLYQELRSLAAARLAAESPAHTLTPTALVHEVYLRLNKEGHLWAGKDQFFAAAAEAMRRILIEHWRRKNGPVRRPPGDRVDLDHAIDGLLKASEWDRADLLALDRALDEFAKEDERAHRVVMLRFFAGLTGDQVAAQLGVDERTVKRDWKAARLWLQRRMTGGDATKHGANG